VSLYDRILSESTRWQPQPDKTAHIKSLKRLRKTATGRNAGDLGKVLQAAAYRAKTRGEDAFIVQGNSFMSRVFAIVDDPVDGLRTYAIFKPTTVLKVTPNGDVMAGEVDPGRSGGAVS
jgi:hypothetical protein